jgi:hypothetical protein
MIKAILSLYVDHHIIEPLALEAKRLKVGKGVIVQIALENYFMKQEVENKIINSQS